MKQSFQIVSKIKNPGIKQIVPGFLTFEVKTKVFSEKSVSNKRPQNIVRNPT